MALRSFDRIDVSGLARRVRALLETSLPADVAYHDAWHTFDDVAPAADRIATAERLDRRERVLVHCAALLHDVGFIHGPHEHESKSVDIARTVLPEYGFDPTSIARIADLIMATRLGHVPSDLSEAVLMDADLDVLGRDDYWPRNRALRRELAASGLVYTDAAWWQSQLRFLQGHRYQTPSTRRLREPRKRVNIEGVERRIARLAAGGT